MNEEFNPKNIKLNKYHNAIMELIFIKGIIKNANEVAIYKKDDNNVGHYKKALTELLHKKNKHIIKTKAGFIASSEWGTMKNKDLWASFFDKKLINSVVREIKRNKKFRECIFGVTKEMGEKYKKSDEYLKDTIKKKVKPKIFKIAKN